MGPYALVDRGMDMGDIAGNRVRVLSGREEVFGQKGIAKTVGNNSWGVQLRALKLHPVLFVNTLPKIPLSGKAGGRDVGEIAGPLSSCLFLMAEEMEGFFYQVFCSDAEFLVKLLKGRRSPEVVNSQHNPP